MPTFDDTLSDFLAHLRGLGRAQNTLDAYRRDLAQFLAFAQDAAGAAQLTGGTDAQAMAQSAA